MFNKSREAYSTGVHDAAESQDFRRAALLIHEDRFGALRMAIPDDKYKSRIANFGILERMLYDSGIWNTLLKEFDDLHHRAVYYTV